jgi:hypothetical protein
MEKGASSDVVVELKIDPGYHINANPPTLPYLKATELEIPQDQGFVTNFIRYPEGKIKKFAFAEQSLAVYEGEALLKVNLSANKSVRSGEQKLGVHLRVQACDDQVCYAPGVIDFGIPVTVK